MQLDGLMYFASTAVAQYVFSQYAYPANANLAQLDISAKRSICHA
jgi:hypothetical protein